MAFKVLPVLLRKTDLFGADSLNKNRYGIIRYIFNIPQYTHPILTPSKIKEVIEKSNLTICEGPTCFKIAECDLCAPFKKKGSSGRSAERFINKNSGHFVCELCKCSGPWHVFEKLLRKTNERTNQEVVALRDGCVSYYEKGQTSWKRIQNENVPLQSLVDEEYSSVFSSFRFTKCSKSVIEKLSIYISHDKTKMYIPMFSSTQLVLGYLVADHSNHQIVPKNNCAGLLVFAQRRKQSSAIIVSNLIDFFALTSLNLSIHIICLPYGVSNLPQIALPFLESYESLTLWLGSVQGAWDAARLFAKKLGEKRCSLIRSTKERSSPTVAVAEGEDIIKIIGEAQPTWHQAITNFASLRNDVLTELKNFDQVLGVRWQRFPGLNKTLKGFRRGELTVITGPTGSGKTTFMSEYSLDLSSQGVNTLWGSFEVRNVRLARTMLHQFVGKPLEENLSEYDNWADDFEKLPIYFLTFHGQQSIRNVMDAVQHAAYIHDIGHVIIDNVQFMIGMNEDSKYTDRFHKQDLIIHAFRQYATRNNVHVTLVIHPRKERETEDLTTSSIFGGAKAAQEADNVLIIQDKRLTSTKGKKYLQVAKNRYTGDLGLMLLDFDKNSLSFKPKKKKSVEAITEDNLKIVNVLEANTVGGSETKSTSHKLHPQPALSDGYGFLHRKKSSVNVAHNAD